MPIIARAAVITPGATSIPTTLPLKIVASPSMTAGMATRALNVRPTITAIKIPAPDHIIEAFVMTMIGALTIAIATHADRVTQVHVQDLASARAINTHHRAVPILAHPELSIKVTGHPAT